jgi:putative FmdB family regulatory protein
MPLYDYLCTDCGPFTEMMPMAAYDVPHECPSCGTDAPRAILTMPNFNGMDGSKRNAHVVNERSAHAPQTSALSGKHPPGCGCCKTTSRSNPGAMKSFAGTRPWMISH